MLSKNNTYIFSYFLFSLLLFSCTPGNIDKLFKQEFEKTAPDLKKLEDYIKAGAKLEMGEDSYLIKALMTKSTEICILLIENNADVTARNEEGKTALELALAKKYFDVAKILIEHGADINVVDDNNRTVLMQAIINNDSEMFHFLIENNASLDAGDSLGRNALFFAIQFENIEFVDTLLKKIVLNPSYNIQIEILIDLALSKNSLEILRLFFESGLDADNALWNMDFLNSLYPNMDEFISIITEKTSIQACPLSVKNYALWVALKLEHRKALSELLKAGADVNNRSWDDKSRSYTPLYYAVKNNNFELAQLLIQHNADVNLRVIGNLSALHIAVINDNTDMVALLLKNDADVNAIDGYGCRPIDYAYNKANSKSLLSLLRDRGALEDYKIRQELQQSLWEKIYEYLEYESEQALNFNIESDVEEEQEDTPEDEESEKPDYLAEIAELLKKGANLNLALSTWEPSPFIFSIKEGYFKLFNLFLENNADPNELSDYFYTPLGQAIATNNVEIAKLLIDNGADINIKWVGRDLNYSPLFQALLNYNWEIAYILIENGADVNEILPDLGRPLIYALKLNIIDVFTLLLEYGAWAGQYNDEVPLLIAIIHENIDAVKILLKYNTNPSVFLSKNSIYLDNIEDLEFYDNLDRTMLTALDYCLLTNKTEMAKLLLAAGGRTFQKELLPYIINSLDSSLLDALLKLDLNIDAYNHMGRTALINASEKGNAVIVKLLLENGASLELNSQAPLINPGSESYIQAPALYFAVANGHTETAIILIEAGADINSKAIIKYNRTNDGVREEIYTLLQIAPNQHLKDLLIQAGALEM